MAFKKKSFFKKIFAHNFSLSYFLSFSLSLFLPLNFLWILQILQRLSRFSLKTKIDFSLQTSRHSTDTIFTQSRLTTTAKASQMMTTKIEWVTCYIVGVLMNNINVILHRIKNEKRAQARSQLIKVAAIVISIGILYVKREITDNVFYDCCSD